MRFPSSKQYGCKVECELFEVEHGVPEKHGQHLRQWLIFSNHYIVKDGKEYSVKCSGDFDRATFHYDHRDQVENVADYWMGGDSDNFVNGVHYLASSGKKYFTVVVEKDHKVCNKKSFKLSATEKCYFSFWDKKCY